MATLFDPDRLQEIARRAVGVPPERMFETLARHLERAWPGHIERQCHWIFNNAGGAMGQIALLHASLSEYLLLFGTPIGTEGHSGRYRVHIWDFVIAGEVWCYREGELERRVYKPGDSMFLGPREAKGYRIPDSAWMLEYGRGPIPSVLPFGLADTVTSTLDFRNLARSVWHYGRLTWRELRHGKL